jgi:hypothetical protein
MEGTNIGVVHREVEGPFKRTSKNHIAKEGIIEFVVTTSHRLNHNICRYAFRSRGQKKR